MPINSGDDQFAHLQGWHFLETCLNHNRKTFEHTTHIVYLYDLEHKTKLDQIEFCETIKLS